MAASLLRLAFTFVLRFSYSSFLDIIHICFFLFCILFSSHVFSILCFLCLFCFLTFFFYNFLFVHLFYISLKKMPTSRRWVSFSRRGWWSAPVASHTGPPGGSRWQSLTLWIAWINSLWWTGHPDCSLCLIIRISFIFILIMSFQIPCLTCRVSLLHVYSQYAVSDSLLELQSIRIYCKDISLLHVYSQYEFSNCLV